MIGILTPESEGEKNIERIKKELKKAGLTHPVAIDNKATMWQRYSNYYWPSIYVFDKKGIARWGWAGELNANGAKGDVHLRKKIEELLRE